MLCHDAIKHTRHAISKRVNDHIISQYIRENREKSAETIPQVAWKMFQKGYSYSDVLAEIQRLNATSSHPFPIAELEKMARKHGKL